jgi:hypothetical protein
LDAIIIYFSIISQYREGIMEQVIANRQSGSAWVSLPMNLPRTDGYIAVRDCNELENIWWVKSPNGIWESMLVVDCARPAGTDGAAEWMDDENVAMEVDYETAVRWGTVGRGIWAEWAKSFPAGPTLER